MAESIDFRKKEISEKIKKPLTWRTPVVAMGAVIAVNLAGWIGCNLYQHHNIRYETDESVVARKADGIMAWTNIEVYKDGGVKVTRYHPFINYRDRNGDGFVDNVFISEGLFARGPDYRDFERDRHLNKYPGVFKDADRELREQKERFKDLLK